MKILVTGAGGFVGRNVCQYFAELDDITVVPFLRQHSLGYLRDCIQDVDVVFHLAGVNRPDNDQDFHDCNVDLTRHLCNELKDSSNKARVIFTSSSQVAMDNPYGISKLHAEQVLEDLNVSNGNGVHIFRLPNVFGKWAKPNYNSVVSTFCHNMSRGLDVRIHDAKARLRLVYIDDVVKKFVELITQNPALDSGMVSFEHVLPEYTTTVGDLYRAIDEIRSSRSTLKVGSVGEGLMRALYSTYVSYLPPDSFSYSIPSYRDQRGVFVEMLKTDSSGQFSYFTAKPGVTRGGHYHHSKTEKFLVLQGVARFRFMDIVDGTTVELTCDDQESKVVETVPGWAHDVTNIGEDDLIVMLWANEVFDRQHPDTYSFQI